MLAAGLWWLAAATQPLVAQTVIGGSVPDSSATLDIQSTTRGVLFPRLTTAQRDAIVNPAEGLMVYNVTTKCLEINFGTTATPAWSPVRCPDPAAGTLESLDCTNAALTGTLTPDSVATGVSVKVPYTGGNGGIHSGQTVTSTGVTGLTATLASGSFATGADSLTYSISGTPDTAGTASFALNIGGQACTLELTVGGGSGAAPSCWAMVSETDTLHFMCHNLAAANTSADPFTPSWEIIGGYWQWGRKGPDPTQWLNTNTPNFAHGPTDGTTGTNEAAVAGWSTAYAPSGAWSDATPRRPTSPARSDSECRPRCNGMG